LSDKRVLLIDKRNLLINKRGLLINKKVLICILNSKGITVYNLRIKYTLARKIDSEVTLTYSLRLIKRISYKARDLIEFKRGKEFNGFDLFLNLFFTLFY
jgi:hypothetical protein